VRWISRVGIVWMAFVSAGCGNLEEYGSSGEVFEATFHVQPPASIRRLQAYGRTFADNSTCYLRFQISQPQLNGLLGTSFTTLTLDEFRISGGSIAGPVPAWWTPLAGSPTVLLRSGAFQRGYSQQQALVSYDPSSQVAHVYWNASD
jgi:hypothetical protein